MRGKGVSERSNRKFTTLRVGVTSLAVFVLLDDLHDRFLLSFFSSSNHSLERLLYHWTNSRTMICTRSPRIEMMRKLFLRDGEGSREPDDVAVCPIFHSARYGYMFVHHPSFRTWWEMACTK